MADDHPNELKSSKKVAGDKKQKNKRKSISDSSSAEGHSQSRESIEKHKAESGSTGEADGKAAGKPASGDAKPNPPANLVAGVCASYESCIVEAREGATHGCVQDIHIGRFAQAFRDLLPIMRLLGTAFYFVEQDIVQKLDAITGHQAKQKDQDYAVNLIDFINWEKENNPKILTDKNSAARHTLRLMRALHFISLFLDKLDVAGVEPKPAAKEAYAVSLSQFHPWSVRTAVSVAFYTLPYRKNFLKHLKLDPTTASPFTELVTVTTKIRDILNIYYDANNWQNLP